MKLKTDPLKFNYNVEFKFEESRESAEMPLDFFIEGVAINAITTANNHKFLPEVLESSAPTMIGVPLLKDHNNSVDSIVGKVHHANFREDKILFKARVVDDKMKSLIKQGVLNSVSIGADISSPNDIEEGPNGELIPKNIIFRELSLVAVPADSGATFANALREAYNSYSSIDDKIELKGGQTMEENAKEIVETVSKEEFSKLSEAVKGISELLAKLMNSVEELKVKEADVDEPTPAEPKEEPVEPEAPAEEPKEEEAEEVEEKSGLKFAEERGSLRGGAFTVKRW